MGPDVSGMMHEEYWHPLKRLIAAYQRINQNQNGKLHDIGKMGWEGVRDPN